jgi:diguanylate cyclase (GGDEF)-like protein
LAFKISPFSSEFTDRTVEAHFVHHVLPRTMAQLRCGMLGCAAFAVIFALADVLALGFGTDALMLFVCRCLVAAVAVDGWFSLRRHPDSVARMYATSSLAEIAVMLTFVPLLLLRPADLAWHTMSIALVSLAIYVYIPNRYLWKVAIATISSLIFILLALTLHRPEPDSAFTMVMLLAVANAIGWTAARRHHVVRREEYCIASELRYLSERDPLTGCHNRRYLQHELLTLELTRARRFRQSVAVIACDIDFFKHVNDTHGHPAGDAVLVSFAGLLRGLVRENVDKVIRLGGEEFLLVLPETDLAGATRLAERMRVTLEKTRMPVAPGREVGVTASFGVTSVDFTSVTQRFPQDDLLDLADQLVYAAKRGGRNAVRAQAFDAMAAASEASA